MSDYKDGKLFIGIKTILFDKENEQEYCNFMLPASKTTPQEAGSLITYLKRYTLSAIFGIAADDDDGNAASHRYNRQSSNQTKQVAKTKPKDSDPAPDKWKLAIKEELTKYADLINMDHAECIDKYFSEKKLEPKKITRGQATKIGKDVKRLLEREQPKEGLNND